MNKPRSVLRSGEKRWTHKTCAEEIKNLEGVEVLYDEYASRFTNNCCICDTTIHNAEYIALVQASKEISITVLERHRLAIRAGKANAERVKHQKDYEKGRVIYSSRRPLPKVQPSTEQTREWSEHGRPIAHYYDAFGIHKEIIINPSVGTVTDKVETQDSGVYTENVIALPWPTVNNSSQTSSAELELAELDFVSVESESESGNSSEDDGSHSSWKAARRGRRNEHSGWRFLSWAAELVSAFRPVGPSLNEKSQKTN